MATADGSENSIPSELKEKLAAFDTSLSDMEKIVHPWLEVPESELHEKLSPLDKAKLDLVGAYTINSLFWMYLNVCGEKPKEHAVKQELDRIRSYMTRVKDVQDKLTIMPHIDKGAAKRFQRNALWQAAKGQQGTDNADGSVSAGDKLTRTTPVPGTSSEDVITVPGISVKKRKKRNDDEELGDGLALGETKSKKKKKKKDKK
ncbi:nuclear nucleic acid-binding protein C1D-like [Mizuhopecten yessoensis]|uniref:Nuclear nucleic acid-binding protein C1D n=1 Tax=Mizuhopecten yessoensis TaxID=6573 RepID=A0A210R014_MIZYE|nr:nuclear nucleic acid-binding protein C1D-like [Mizuhopecten yessoensis]OWF54334.1 Nuclear nucleic acid-binding protein C1D [Mizuhopecten yessoensis]